MPNDQQDWTSVVARPQSQLSGSPWAYSVGGNTKTFALAPDTSIVSLLVPDFPNISQVTITGTQSGFQYVKEFPTFTSYHPYYMAVVNSAVDTQVTVGIITGVANTAYVSSIPDAVASVVLPNQPAPWQAPNQPCAKVDFGNPGQNNTVTVVSAPVNAQSIWLHTLAYKWNAAPASAFGVWQQSDGTEIGADVSVVAGGWQFTDFKGVKLSGGTALQFKQTSTAAASTFFAQGFCTYSIY